MGVGAGDKSGLSKNLPLQRSFWANSSPRLSRGTERTKIRAWRPPCHLPEQKARGQSGTIAKAQRTTQGSGERDTESARRPTTAVVAALVAEALKLDRPQTMPAEVLFVLDRHDRRKSGRRATPPEVYAGRSLAARRNPWGGRASGRVTWDSASPRTAWRRPRRSLPPRGGAKVLSVAEADELHANSADSASRFRVRTPLRAATSPRPKPSPAVTVT